MNNAEAHPILYKDSESRAQCQARLNNAEAHPILYKDGKISRIWASLWIFYFFLPIPSEDFPL
jgi:hypothetical protein